MLSTRISCVMISSFPVLQPHSQSASQSDHGVTPCKHILLADQLTLSECALYAANAKVKSAVSGTDILCYAQQSPCKGVELESFLTTIDENGFCKIGLKNVTSTPVKLKAGVLLEEALPYFERVVILDDLPSSINNVSASDSHDISSLPPITNNHFSVLDFPESQHELLALLNSFRNVLSLPGEPLGHTDVITYAIYLTPGSRPSYTPQL